MLIKLTKNQQKILQILKSINQEITAQELYIKLRESKLKIGLATVYRTLNTLHLKGFVQERNSLNGESLYSLISDNHHHTHHFNCINCGESFLLKQKLCPVDDMFNQWCSSQNFKLYYHTLEFFGICEACQEKEFS
ncbi:Fur family transcriptional regulator [Cyanobacterium aponinum UTEX 3222]|uniref:Ferric uptake regulator, Fur family n=1 Tax=Cyanobacterium aponinum (strain PCC 10605) TaxID=755178 RepID=K9Z9H9_CYAAP|nr:Fur family transcriptional regulator [Cyanobacterium aponinum]AFZ55382.1 ferric uptake regulator, Fur family [Cyanobacterium aponinum PCC 10605]PHV62834.1 transcriptional repressor [Cyanobacterium aponinum IPPAS B-1201]WRL39754.1 Fur family transcriptional regulator [Cyanobacterium aponinum UTEX 3221]WRL42594.1 Fur family transcriptional regulator [Cyanobacterium aponinum UTEX 3222]